MKWTYDLPKTDGFYWWKIESNAPPTVCQFVDGRIYTIATAQSFGLHHFTYQQFSDVSISYPKG